MATQASNASSVQQSLDRLIEIRTALDNPNRFCYLNLGRLRKPTDFLEASETSGPGVGSGVK
jgi:hypothetical protein